MFKLIKVYLKKPNKAFDKLPEPNRFFTFILGVVVLIGIMFLINFTVGMMLLFLIMSIRIWYLVSSKDKP